MPQAGEDEATPDISGLLREFSGETTACLDGIVDGIMRLERSPENRESLDQVFRHAHTLKGSARMLELHAVQVLAHQVEEVLGVVRRDQVPLRTAAFDAILDATDRLRSLLEAAARGEIDAEPPPDVLELCERLVLSLSAPDASSSPAPVRRSDAASEQGLLGSGEHSIRISTEKLDRQLAIARDLAVQAGKAKDLLERVTSLYGHTRACGRQSSVCSTELENEQQALLGQLEVSLGELRADFDGYVRVVSSRIGEIYQHASDARMVPVRELFRGSARLTRELSRDLGKEVELCVVGENTELDRAMVEALRLPLQHAIRNAMDHGIEAPLARQAASKPACAKLTLRAFHHEDEVVIEVEDDGAGIRADDVREAAVIRGLCSEERARELTDLEALYLIFLPGFSTRSRTSAISGRGVGLDAVRQSVEALAGSLDVISEPGRGTCFSMRLPLVLSRVRALIWRVGGELFALPTSAVKRVARFDTTQLDTFAGAPLLKVDDECIPLRELDWLGRVARPQAEQVALVVSHMESAVAITVDELVSELDLVVTPLSSHFVSRSLVSGSALLGSGEVVIVLHPKGVVGSRELESAIDASHGRLSFLVVDDSVQMRSLVKGMLEAAGYQVFTANNGSEALQAAKQQLFDGVVTDFDMPILNGISLARALRRLPEYARRPIVFVTTRDSEEDRRRGYDAGGTGYLIKGRFSSEELLAAIEGRDA